jgi:hypothetical protein
MSARPWLLANRAPFKGCTDVALVAPHGWPIFDKNGRARAYAQTEADAAMIAEAWNMRAAAHMLSPEAADELP